MRENKIASALSNTSAIFSTVSTIDTNVTIALNMQHDSSMAIVVSHPVRRPLCCVNRNVRYGSQGTHRAPGVFSGTGVSWRILHSWLVEYSLWDNSQDLHSGFPTRSGILYDMSGQTFYTSQIITRAVESFLGFFSFSISIRLSVHIVNIGRQDLGMCSIFDS